MLDSYKWIIHTINGTRDEIRDPPAEYTDVSSSLLLRSRGAKVPPCPRDIGGANCKIDRPRRPAPA